MKWYYQVVHHPIWDIDMSSPPLLVDINVAGKPIKAVAVPSKICFLYTFDRLTGKPVWPINEKPVPQSDVPGEQTSKTQPFPSKPVPYCRQQVGNDDLVDYTPDLKAKAQDIIKKYYKMSPEFGPAVVSNPTGGFPSGTMLIGNAGGGTNWPGAGFNPETQVVFAPAVNDGAFPLGLVPLPEGLSDLKYDQGTGGQVFRIAGAAGFGDAPDAPKVSLDDQKLAAALAAHPQHAVGPPPPFSVDGLPFVKPPYGLLTAINLNTGDTMWQVPNGDTPDSIKNNPALKGVTMPAQTGNSANVGEVVTKNLVIQGDGEYVTAPGHPRGAYLRAWDQKNGAQVGAVYMPAPQSGSPMSYSYDGKQYIMVAVSGGNYSGDYLAYALPNGQ
jgi:quinoprotein glucose dehydrogenase